MYIEESRVVEEDFVANGTLLVYFKQTAPEGFAIAPLPFSGSNSFFYFAIADIPDQDVAGIVLVYTSTDGSSLAGLGANVEVRYILIPGGVPAKMNDNFLKDYQAVKEYYGIPD